MLNYICGIFVSNPCIENTHTEPLDIKIGHESKAKFRNSDTTTEEKQTLKLCDSALDSSFHSPPHAASAVGVISIASPGKNA